MKILMLADADSTHTFRWVKYLCESGIRIFLFSLRNSNLSEYSNIKNLYLSSSKINNDYFNYGNGNFRKFSYLTSVREIKRIINTFKPDIIHAHYATSYGLLGALTNFHPYLISAWGTDILKFPEVSFLHKSLLKFNLKKADRILATSDYLAKKTSEYYDGKIDVTPFGIDTKIFKPENASCDSDAITIGTVKSMENSYGIDILIKAFKLVTDRKPNIKLRLLLVGGGTKLNEYKKLSGDLGIMKVVTFAGYVNHNNIANYHNMIDIEVFLSKYESFGVSVLEASACEKPVIVNKVGGLTEVVENNVTGLFVEPGNIEDAAAAIEKLMHDKPLRELLGKNGRQKVLDEYSWQSSVDKMIKIYSEVLNKNK